MFVFRDVSRVHVIPFFQLHPILAGKTVLFPTCSKLDVNGVNFHLCFFGVYKHCFPGKVSIFPNQELGRMSFFCLRCNMLLYVRWAFNIYELFKYTYVTWGKYLYIYIYVFVYRVCVYIYIHIFIYHLHQILFHPILFGSKVSQPNKRKSYLGSTRKLSQDPGYAFAYNNLAVLNPQVVGPRKGGPCLGGMVALLLWLKWNLR